MKYDFERRGARESNAPFFTFEERASVLDGLKHIPEVTIAAAILLTIGTKVDSPETQEFICQLARALGVELTFKHAMIVMQEANIAASYFSDNFLPQRNSDEKAEDLVAILRDCSAEVFAWRRAQ